MKSLSHEALSSCRGSKQIHLHHAASAACFPALFRAGALLLICLVASGSLAAKPPKNGPEPILFVVMDPLARELACACVKGYGQRDYRKLAAHLETALKQQVAIADSGNGQKAHKVNVNKANAAELRQVPGIGAPHAEAIMQHRQERGPIHNVDEIDDLPHFRDQSTLERQTIKNALEV